jgi:hypothetical protein
MSLAHQLQSSALRFRRRPTWAAALVLAFGTGFSSHAATLCVNTGGTGGCYKTITAAVSAAKARDVINVSPGTYKEQMTITKAVSLISTVKWGAVIDATGISNGIFINGMAAAPNAGVGDVTVSAFLVKNANFEGILVANATNVTLVDNSVISNDKALNISTPACPGIPAFETNEGEDCGEGIHLMGTHLSSIMRNTVAGNSGGILISDETGPSFENVISDNFVHNNPFDCGITLASHAPATSVIPTATLPYGLRANTISNNKSWTNGTQAPGAGAGVGIFAPFPGTTNAGNVVIGNDLRNNGLPGVTMHNHAWSAHAPAVNMDSNSIIGNYFSNNAADTDDAATAGPTGINLYSVAPVYGTVILKNVFDDEAFDLVINIPGGQASAHLNSFDTGVGLLNKTAGTISATQNWWDCQTGPAGGNCASVQGPGITTAPWLTTPYTAADADDY